MKQRCDNLRLMVEDQWWKEMLKISLASSIKEIVNKIKNRR